MTTPVLSPLSWDSLRDRVASRGLWAIGGFHPDTSEAHLPPGTASLVLLAPLEPGFWPMFQATPEYRDGQAHPMDRWSRRVITDLAQQMDGTALFPFSGPPWQPFLDWAGRTGQLHVSPVGMLVHPQAGLFASLRGALALPHRIEVPAPAPSPCATCVDHPCLTACPVGALGHDGYDVARCHDWLDSEGNSDGGTGCMDAGCRARRACPISVAYPRAPEQSAFHMRSFHRVP